MSFETCSHGISLLVLMRGAPGVPGWLWSLSCPGHADSAPQGSARWSETGPACWARGVVFEGGGAEGQSTAHLVSHSDPVLGRGRDHVMMWSDRVFCTRHCWPSFPLGGRKWAVSPHSSPPLPPPSGQAAGAGPVPAPSHQSRQTRRRRSRRGERSRAAVLGLVAGGERGVFWSEREGSAGGEGSFCEWGRGHPEAADLEKTKNNNNLRRYPQCPPLTLHEVSGLIGRE